MGNSRDLEVGHGYRNHRCDCSPESRDVSAPTSRSPRHDMLVRNPQFVEEGLVENRYNRSLLNPRKVATLIIFTLLDARSKSFYCLAFYSS